jgi:hypothetical protein
MSSTYSKRNLQALIAICLFMSIVQTDFLSSGQDLNEYADCMKSCKNTSCSGNMLIKFEQEQNTNMWLLGWSCLDEVNSILLNKFTLL